MFTVEFVFEKETILEYAAEDSCVIDLEDVIGINELRTMIRNCYSKFKEKFKLRKLGTAVLSKSILPFDETRCDLEPLLRFLQ